MNLIDIIVGFDYDSSSNLITEDDIAIYENLLSVSFGEQLQHYITNYGYLALDDIEFYGINSNQKENSDLIKQTIYLNKNFDSTKGYIAFENKGDGVYILIDSNDNMYKFSTEDNKLEAINSDLFNYISDRFNN